MSSLVTSVQLQVIFDYQKTIGAGITMRPRPMINLRQTLNNGSGLNASTKVYGPTTRSLASSAQEELDLSGTLTDIYGDVVQFTKIHGIYVHNITTTVGAKLEVGGVIGTVENLPLFKDTSDIFPLGPDGVLFWQDPSAAGVAVTPGTGDLLRFGNTSSPAMGISYDVAIWGE